MKNKIPGINILREVGRPKMIRYIFDPKEDITAYELALCLPYTQEGTMFEWGLQENIKRHFKIVEDIA